MLHVEFKTFTKKRSKAKSSFPTGTVLFTGGQGKGKTLSATHYIARLKRKYPDMYIYSNIDLSIADKVLKVEEIPEYILDQKDVPIAFLLDEIQTVLFAKDSGNKAMSFETLRAIAQQRKARKTIIGTLQEYLDLDPRYRRQLKQYVEVAHFGPVQFELWKDGENLKFDKKAMDYTGRVSGIRVWKRHDEAYRRYDTYQIVEASMNLDADKQQRSLSQPRGVAPMTTMLERRHVAK